MADRGGERGTLPRPSIHHGGDAPMLLARQSASVMCSWTPRLQQRRALAESPRRRGNLGIPPDPKRRHWPMTERHPESLRHQTDFASRRQELCQESLTCGAVIGPDRAAVPRNDHIHPSTQPQLALFPAPGRQMDIPRTVMAHGPGKNLNETNSPRTCPKNFRRKKKKPRSAFRL